MLIPLDEVVHFDMIVATPSTWAAVDADSTPTFAVYEEATDTAILDAQNFTKRTSLTGNYRGTFTASTANGFEVGKWYSVIGTAVVGGVTIKQACQNFRLLAAETTAGLPNVYLASAQGAVTFTGTVTISDGLVVARSTNNQPAIRATGMGTGSGMILTGGTGTSSVGLAISSQASTNGVGLQVSGFGSGAGHGMQIASAGTGDGINIESAGTGSGVEIIGGGTSGTGITITTTDGHGVSIDATGANRHGINISGGDSGTADGIRVSAPSGSEINADLIGTVSGVTNTYDNGRGGRWWYIATTGDNSNAGTQSAPKLTLGNAISSCANNDSIFVTDGTYALSAGLTLSKKNVEIRGQSTAGAIINYTYDETNAAAISVTGSGCTIRNLTITTTDDGWPISIVDASNVSILDNILDAPLDGLAIETTNHSTIYNRDIVVRGNKISSDYDALVAYNTSGLVIENNHFTARSTYATNPTSDNRGLLLFTCLGVIKNNLIDANVPASGSNISSPHTLSGILASGACSLEIVDNRINARADLTTYSGTIYGVLAINSLAGSEGEVYVNGNSIRTSQAGSSAAAIYDAGTTGDSDSRIYACSRSVSSAKITGEVYLDPAEVLGITEDLATANASLADLEAGGIQVAPNLVPVPAARTWTLVQGSTGLVGDRSIGIRVGDSKAFAVDFRNDLSANGLLTVFDSMAITTGTAGGVTFDAADKGVNRTRAIIEITGVTAGTYTLTATATYDDSDGGGTAKGVVTLIVT